MQGLKIGCHGFCSLPVRQKYEINLAFDEGLSPYQFDEEYRNHRNSSSCRQSFCVQIHQGPIELRHKAFTDHRLSAVALESLNSCQSLQLYLGGSMALL